MEHNSKWIFTCAFGLLSFVGASFFLRRLKNGTKTVAQAFEYLQIRKITSKESCDSVIQDLLSRISQHKAVGFDCEWVTVNGKRQPVAMIQISTYDGLCGLFRMSHMKNVPHSLKELLENPSIYKIGVAPGDDAKHLRQDYNITLKTSLDVRYIAQLCGHYNPGGLAALSHDILNVTLDKNYRVRCSDWEAAELTEAQTLYAAADAHVAIKIFVDLMEKYGKRNILYWLPGRSRNVWSELDAICASYTNVAFKDVHRNVKRKEKHGNNTNGAVAPSERYANSIRTKPLYNNCFLEAPDGELLCTCDMKKAQWYLNKEIADKINDDPLTVRLRFEPAGRAVGNVGKYYQLKKENICVVCGNDESYIRKNVVPKEYRKYFPEIMKGHSSHDVVLLCCSCHKRSNCLDQAVREQLAIACRAPLANHEHTRYTQDIECKKIRSVARALLHQSQRQKLPEERREYLESVLAQYYQHEGPITQELLDRASQIQFLVENPEYECHGSKVVDYYSSHEGLLKLEELWREHFLNTMRPLYLPEHWSVKHNEERLRVELEEGRLSTDDIRIVGFSSL